MRQMRIAGSILAVMLLLSACANSPDEEMAVPSLDATVEMPSGGCLKSGILRMN